MKRYIKTAIVLGSLLAACLIAALLRPLPEDAGPAKRLVGYISTLSEDTMGDQLEAALLAAAGDRGYQILSVSASNTQESQTEALRILLASTVDVVVFSPVCESGWDTQLREAWALRIPIVTVMRSLNTANECALYHVGYDYRAQAAEIMDYLASNAAEPTRIFVLSGTIGSSVTREITVGLRDCETDLLTVDNRAYGNFMRSRGREIVQGIFRHNNEIDVIISCNESMALGAVDAFQTLGIGPGAVRICLFNGIAGGEAWAGSGYISYGILCDIPALAEEVMDTIALAASDRQGTETVFLPYTAVCQEVGPNA